jgi:putative addiction module component (TIGR02574 family)
MAAIVIEDLSVEERLDLISRLWESLEPCDIQLSPAQLEELDRRLDADERGDEPMIPWDEMMARLRQRLR